MKTFQDLRTEQAIEDSTLFISLEIAGKLMAIRSRENISQRELSRRSGVPQKTISRIESGMDIPKIPTLLKLAKSLGVQVKISLEEVENLEEDSIYN